MRGEKPAVHRQDVALEVPESGWVDSNIDEISSDQFVLLTRMKMKGMKRRIVANISVFQK